MERNGGMVELQKGEREEQVGDVDSEKDKKSKSHRAHADSLAIDLYLQLLTAQTEYLPQYGTYLLHAQPVAMPCMALNAISLALPGTKARVVLLNFLGHGARHSTLDKLSGTLTLAPY